MKTRFSRVPGSVMAHSHRAAPNRRLVSATDQGMRMHDRIELRISDAEARTAVVHVVVLLCSTAHFASVSVSVSLSVCVWLSLALSFCL